MLQTGLSRRSLLLGSVIAPSATAVAGRFAHADTLNPGLPAGTRSEIRLVSPPGKRDLLQLSGRPPNLETPLDGFTTAITPNDRFFVRYHLANLPTEQDMANWSLTVGGDAAEREVRFTLADLKAMPSAEITAICQCSGNRRGLFSPHVAGVEWGIGAMGNAVWRGVRLRDVLARAGVKPGAVEVVMQGADGPVLDVTPAFRKSLPLDRALDETVLLAWEMNGAQLPLWNGLPVRVVVPGWTGTYWMKHVTRLDLVSKPFDGFWMAKGYRVPRGVFPVDRPFATQDNDKTSPITEIVVNSLITAPRDGDTVGSGGFTVQGLAWDGGHGIARVDISTDGGATWQPAKLGPDAGRFAFRPWSFAMPGGAGPAITVQARATAANGATQPGKLVMNPAGYNHNIIATVTVRTA